MVNICLCDDNPEVLRQYASMIGEIAQKNKIAIQLLSYSSGEQLLFEAEDQLAGYDIVYLDMLMQKMDGIQTAKQMRALGFEGKIIFLTSSRDHALESFDVTPLHYIVKQDITPARFEEIFLKAVSLVRDFQKEWFVFENKSTKSRVLLEDISYFEVQKRLVYLHTRDVVYNFYAKIEQVEKRLCEKYFVRCHRAFVVNLRYIRSISSTGLALQDGIAIPMGSTYLKNVKYQFSKFLESKSVIV